MPSPKLESSVEPYYVLVDSSGSTARNAWLDSCYLALPSLVTALESDRSDPIAKRLCLISYATESSIQIGLSNPADIAELPPLRAVGLSSLASAFELLAEILPADQSQCRSDGESWSRPKVIVVMDDLPTDPSDSVLDASRILMDVGPAPCLHSVAPASLDGLSLSGIGFSKVVGIPPGSSPEEMARLIPEAFHCERCLE
jgi:hypothetical protein